MAAHYEHLILKSLSGTITSEEKQELESWINESAANRRVAEDLQQVWKLSKDDVAIHDFKTAQEWSRLEASIEGENKSRATVVTITQTAWFRMAASLLLLALSTCVVYLIFFASNEIVHSAGGSMLSLTLPDGSRVWLNAQSRISHDADFSGDVRCVSLEGEAFFEVKTDPGRPFIVSTDQAEVKVLGTSFDVSASEADQTKVFVVTGKVSFSAREHQNAGVVLTPGEGAALSRLDHTITRTVDQDPNLLAWKEKRLVFRKAALSEVIRTLKQYFKTEITIKNKELLRCHFTSTFNDPTLDEVVEALKESLNLNVERQQNTVIIDGEGC
jgi:ferric-dicitrate binding protein FerR (iron transport regulator)